MAAWGLLEEAGGPLPRERCCGEAGAIQSNPALCSTLFLQTPPQQTNKHTPGSYKDLPTPPKPADKPGAAKRKRASDGGDGGLAPDDGGEGGRGGKKKGKEKAKAQPQPQHHHFFGDDDDDEDDL